jgi:hypothetical protein
MVDEIVIKLFALVDSIVELYLGTVIKPFLRLHETFYSALNSTLRKVLDDNKSKIADWFTANFITYARTILVIPTLLLLAWGHTFLPSLIVILVDFGDFLDGVVARYWVDVKKERAEEEASKDKGSRPTTPTADDDSFGASTSFCSVVRFSRSPFRHQYRLTYSFDRNRHNRIPANDNIVASVALEPNLRWIH